MAEVLLSEAVFLPLVGLLGLVVGSFLNVVVHRLPRMMEREWREHCAELSGAPLPPAEPYNLVVPRSRCPGCGRTVRALENLPLLSYLLQGGRCRGCRMRISPRYPLVEGAAALLGMVVAWRLGPGAAALAACLLTWALLALSVIDLEHTLLPDDITLPVLWLGLLLNVPGLMVPLADAVVGAAAGYLLLWSLYWVFKWVTGKEGMGQGDFKLLALLGAWLGWQALPLILVLSCLVGATVGLTLIALRALERGTPIPFGPYLAGAGWLALLWGGELTGLYLRWAGGP